MEITEMDKMKAVTFIEVLFKDKNIITRCGLGGRGLMSERMTKEIDKFRKMITNFGDSVVRAEVYKSPYFEEKAFNKYPDNLMMTYENGVWTNHKRGGDRLGQSNKAGGFDF